MPVQTLAVSIVNYRTPDLTIACVASLIPARTGFPDLRVMVVDGGSADDSVARIAAAIADRGWSDWVTFIPLEINGGFAFANNRAIAALKDGRHLPQAIALINPDARVRPGALEQMAALLDSKPEVGAVGALLIHEDGRRQSCAFRFPSIRGEFCRGAATGFIDRLLGEPPSSINSSVAVEVPWVTGAAVMLRTASLVETGLFDEGFFLYFEETELMGRLRDHGWTIWHEPAARVVHEGGAATQIRDPETGMPRAQPMPVYWYEARRRYFTLRRGRLVGLISGLAWLAGRMFWQVRQIVAPQVRPVVQHEVSDMFVHGLWPSRFDATSAVRRLDEAAGDRPAWMSR